MAELSEILNKLETGAGFSSKHLESYRDLSEKPKLVEIDHARQKFYEGYEAALLEGATHKEALHKSHSLELTYRASQAETAQKWIKSNEKIIASGAQGIEDEGIRKTVQAVLPLFTEKLSNGRRRFRHDIVHKTLDVLDTQTAHDEGSSPVQDLYNGTKKMVEDVADGKVYGSSELVGRTVKEARKSGAPLATWLFDDGTISDVVSVGITQNRPVNNGLQMLSEPPINAEVILGR